MSAYQIVRGIVRFIVGILIVAGFYAATLAPGLIGA